MKKADLKEIENRLEEESTTNSERLTLWNRVGQILGIYDPEPSGSTNNQESEMALTKDERNDLVGQIVGNCDCADKDILNQLTDGTLAGLSTMAANEMPAFIKKKIDESGGDSGTEKDKKEVHPGGGTAGKDNPNNPDDMDDKKVKEPTDYPQHNAANPFKGMTDEQIRNSLPAGMRDSLDFVDNYRNQQKESLIGQIVGNLQGDDLEEARKVLNAKSLEQLQNDYAFVLKNRPTTRTNDRTPTDYSGLAAGGSVFNRGKETRPENLVPIDPMEVLINDRRQRDQAGV